MRSANILIVDYGINENVRPDAEYKDTRHMSGAMRTIIHVKIIPTIMRINVTT